MPNLVIRSESIGDENEIYELVKSAFSRAEHSDGTEQDLVNNLRRSDAYIKELSLVATLDGKIVGFILFTKVKISGVEVLALAPLAVLPGYQSKSIGGRLILKGHEIAKGLGFRGSIVLGSENYYPKFGYEKASQYKIVAPFDVPDKNFMAIELLEHGLTDVEGIVEYSSCFTE